MAAEALARMEAIDPARPETWRIRAHIAELDGRFGDAAALYTHVVSSHPEPVMVRRCLALCLYRDGRPDDAVRTLLADPVHLARYAYPLSLSLRALVNDGPHDAVHAALDQLGAQDVLPGLRGEIRKALAARVPAETDGARLADTREAADLVARGDWPGARRACQRLHEADPSDPDTIGALARCEVRLAVPGAAATGIARLRTLPATAPCLKQLYVLQVMAGLAAEALETAEALLERVPDSPYAVLRRSRALFDVGRLDDARAALATLGPPRSAAADIRLATATAWWDLGEFEAAIGVLGPPDGSATRPAAHNLALVRFLVATGRFAAARTVIGHWTGGGAAGPAARHEASALLDLAGFDLAGALGHCRLGLAAAPDSPSIRDLEQRCLTGLCRPEEARESLIRSADPSQDPEATSHVPQRALFSFVGGLVNDMMIGRAECARAADALSSRPADAVEALTEIVRETGGATGIAIAMLTALRRDGRFRDAIPSSASDWSPRIPKVVHQYWGEAVLPGDVEAFTARLSDLHPDCDHRLWRRREVKALLRETFDPVVGRAFAAARSPSVRTDLVRLALLAQFGGVFVDVDCWGRGSMAPLVHGTSSFVAFQDESGAVGNAFIACAPDHPIIRQCLDEAAAEICTGSAEFPWLLIGPGRLARTVAQHLARQPASSCSVETRIWARHCVMRHLAIGRPMAHARAPHFPELQRLLSSRARRDGDYRMQAAE
ncbi:hypothetical protein DLJ53_16715 [Acuticoccus sediminis]|uniref:Tetratricopeptide repeat protein n=1 Tax=Acuticoccus sediminis TaxID=2184697 RepID=A0A8B2NTR8_9HYPH|nr:hypothetical protein DLJ53_16715 [Acuticoccus sediminis]